MFTAQNTKGFSTAELVLMNQALEQLKVMGWEESAASDLINNNFKTEGENTVESLTRVSRA
jgi:hypothetical protein